MSDDLSDDEFLTLADYLLQKATSDELRARLIALARIGAAVKPIVPYHVERIISHLQHCVDNFYATEHTPQFNWAEWKDILAALSALPQPQETTT